MSFYSFPPESRIQTWINPHVFSKNSFIEIKWTCHISCPLKGQWALVQWALVYLYRVKQSWSQSNFILFIHLFWLHWVLVAICVPSCFTCVRLCDPMDCSLPGSCVSGILQARILEWCVIPSSRGSSQPSDGTRLLPWEEDFLPLAPPGKRLQYAGSSFEACGI